METFLKNVILAALICSCTKLEISKTLNETANYPEKERILNSELI